MKDDIEVTGDPDASTADAPVKKKNSLLRLLIEMLIIVVVAIVLATLFTRYVMQPYEIPSASMENTIEIGDRIFSEKVSYVFGDPQQGDIITFADPEDPDRILIKRVIATGGQTVDIMDNQVYVDGILLDEPYTEGKPTTDLHSDIRYPYTVPDGYVWVMGDNRTNSADSRAFGPIPLDSVTGHAVITYWPLSRIGIL